jgi:hypothetical protein
MTRKEMIMRMIGKLDDVSYDQVMYHLSVIKGIEIGASGPRGGHRSR